MGSVGFTDLHCHILPGVDDGPETMDESLAYALLAVASGTERIVATPHVERVDVRELPDRVAELQGALAREGIPLALEVGGELKPRSLGTITDAELEVIAHGPPGRRWLLYEVPFRGVDEAFIDGARELVARGFGLVCAHPERSQGLLEGGLGTLQPVLDAGAIIAGNVAPLAGDEGPERHAAALHVLRRGLAAVLATDAHPPRRPFTLADGEYAIEAVTGQSGAARRMTSELPAQLLREGLEPGARRAA
jgi:protein-tyrosine phosphatase